MTTLWEDLPDDLRVDNAFIQDNPPSSKPGQRMAAWRALVANPGCRAAVRFPLTGSPRRFLPCSRKPITKDGFCHIHGDYDDLVAVARPIAVLAVEINQADRGRRAGIARRLADALRGAWPDVADALEWETRR